MTELAIATNNPLHKSVLFYDKQRWRFGTLDEFLTFYNHERPHMSLDWDNLETPAEAFDRLLPTLDHEEINTLLTGGEGA